MLDEFAWSLNAMVESIFWLVEVEPGQACALCWQFPSL
jgi:hypothetical protein